MTKLALEGRRGARGLRGRLIQLDSEEISQKLQQRRWRALLSAPRNTRRTRARSQTAGYPIRGLDHEAREVVYPKEPPIVNLLSVIILKHLMNLTDLLLMPEPELIFLVLWMGTVSGEAPFDEDLKSAKSSGRVINVIK